MKATSVQRSAGAGSSIQSDAGRTSWMLADYNLIDPQEQPCQGAGVNCWDVSRTVWKRRSMGHHESADRKQHPSRGGL